MSGLVLKNISKVYDGKPVLQDISLELTAGELAVLLGPSGCGKSTILRIIAGLEEPTTGEVYIDSKRVDRLRPRDRNVALVFQNYSLYPHMSVQRNLDFPLRVAGMSGKERAARVRRIAEMLGLADRLRDKPGQLSGGQRQRVALGRAMVREPAIFLLDEPLSNLDAELRMRMRHEIVRIQRNLGRTMIHVTHDQAEALTMADRIVLLNDGQLEQIGSPEDLYQRPATRFAALFIGQPQMNLIAARIDSGRLVPFGVQVPDAVAAKAAAGLLAGLRPEAIEIRGDGPLGGRIESCDYMGDEYVVRLSFKEHSLTVSNVSRPIAVGQEVRFTLEASALHYFDPDTGRNLLWA
ncbi:MAG TPA: ABC transporter ATP-binding protein [Acidobacteriota bacterium]|nr:ABC transporter ATP-binding protein [Acidobacteriota bacterium]